MKQKKNRSVKVFEVPNNRNGQSFIRQMKRYLNRGNHVVTLRGRHSNRKQLERDLGGLNYVGDVPLAHAERFAVYINCISGDKIYAKIMNSKYNAEDKLETIKGIVNRTEE